MKIMESELPCDIVLTKPNLTLQLTPKANLCLLCVCSGSVTV